MRIEQRLHQDVDQPGANPRQEKIDVESMRAPGALQVRAEHPQEQHVEQDVPDAVVQEQIGHRLPDSSAQCVTASGTRPNSF